VVILVVFFSKKGGGRGERFPTLAVSFLDLFSFSPFPPFPLAILVKRQAEEKKSRFFFVHPFSFFF
jgi:hypothetical protein